MSISLSNSWLYGIQYVVIVEFYLKCSFSIFNGTLLYYFIYSVLVYKEIFYKTLENVPTACFFEAVALLLLSLINLIILHF